MTTELSAKVRDEAVRAVIFVFVLLAVAEVLSPFFNISFHDPLLLTAFVTGLLGWVVKPSPERLTRVVVVKPEDASDTVHKLCENGIEHSVSFATSSDHALELAKQTIPSKPGIVQRVVGLIQTTK